MAVPIDSETRYIVLIMARIVSNVPETPLPGRAQRPRGAYSAGRVARRNLGVCRESRECFAVEGDPVDLPDGEHGEHVANVEVFRHFEIDEPFLAERA